MTHPRFVAFAVFAAVVSVSALYTASRTRLYEGIAKCDDLLPPVGQSPEREFFTYEQCVGFAKSPRTMGRVAARITGADLDRVLAPYAPSEQHTSDRLLEVLAANSRVWTETVRGPIVIAYRHPDPEVAARIANLYIEEVFTLAIRIRASHPIESIEQAARKLMPHATAFRELSIKADSLAPRYRSAISSPVPLASERKLIADYESFEKQMEIEKRAWLEAEREMKAEMAKHEWEFRSVRRIDWAKPSKDYVFPFHRLHLGVGSVIGIISGFLAALALSRRPKRQATPV